MSFLTGVLGGALGGAVGGGKSGSSGNKAKEGEAGATTGGSNTLGDLLSLDFGGGSTKDAASATASSAAQVASGDGGAEMWQKLSQLGGQGSGQIQGSDLSSLLSMLLRR
jgi:hypothetical protein